MSDSQAGRKKLIVVAGAAVAAIAIIVVIVVVTSGSAGNDLLLENFSDLKFGMTQEEVGQLYPKATKTRDPVNPPWFIEPNHEVTGDRDFVHAGIRFAKNPGGPFRIRAVAFCLADAAGCPSALSGKTMAGTLSGLRQIAQGDFPKKRHLKRVNELFQKYSDRFIKKYGDPKDRIGPEENPRAGPALRWAFEGSDGTYFVFWGSRRIEKADSQEFIGWPSYPFLEVLFLPKGRELLAWSVHR